ncbi:MAG: hypothetical protein AB7G37_17365, partial [Solirubrobacteraceae bacterium]
MRVPRSTLVVLASVVTAFGASSTAGAASWSGSALDLDDPVADSVNDPRVATTPDGTAIAAWYTADDPAVRVVTRAPGAADWSPPVDLTSLVPADAELGDLAGVDDVQVATGRDGTAVVSWWEDHDHGMIVRIAVRRAGGPWTLSSPSGRVEADLDDPFAAVSDDGEIAVAWVHTGGEDELHVRTLAAGVDTWTRPTEAIAGRANEPRLGYLPDGELVGAYQDRDTDAVVVLEQDDGPIALNRGLALGGDSESAEPDLAVSRDGRVVVVWEEEQAGENVLVHSAVRSAAGSWATSPLHRPGTESRLPKVAASDAGFVAAWDTEDGAGSPGIDAATLGAGSSWDATETVVTGLAGPAESDVAVAPDGSATVVWEDLVGGDAVVKARTRPAGDAWDPGVPVAPLALGQRSGPQVAAYDDGSFTAVWRELRNAPGEDVQVVQSALLDRTPPVVVVTLPATTTIGVPLRLSAVVTDRWNPIEAVRWLVTDGPTLDYGPDVEWTPTTLGDHTIELRAQDTQGNETVRTFVVRVVPVVVPPVDEPVIVPPVDTTPVVPPAPVPVVVPERTGVAAAQACATPYVEIIGIRAAGRAGAPRVRLTGVTGPSLVGKAVEVRRDGRRVGSAKVRRDRSVVVSVAAPRRAKARARARYRLVGGDARSRALKATRSARISLAKRRSGGRVAGT